LLPQKAGSGSAIAGKMQIIKMPIGRAGLLQRWEVSLSTGAKSMIPPPSPASHAMSRKTATKSYAGSCA